MQYYTYLIRDPRPEKNNEPIYIGKGKGDRAWHQLRGIGRLNPLLKSIITKCRKINLEPIVEILEYFQNEDEAFKHEKLLIKTYGRRNIKTGTLCNLTDGGEGTSGIVYEPELLKKRAATRKHRYETDQEFAQRLSEISRQSIIKLHEENPNLRVQISKKLSDYSKSPQARERVRQQNADPVFKEASRSRMEQLNQDPEFVAKRDAAMAEVHADPEYQAMMSAWMTEFNARPGVKEAARQRLKARHEADPDFPRRAAEARMLKYVENPELHAAANAKTAEKAKARFQDPVFKAKWYEARHGKKPS